MIDSPNARRVVLATDPDFDPEAETVQFRLTYEGPLFGASRNTPRPKHKHEIRQKFHKQLARLCDLHPAMDWYQDEIEGPERRSFVANNFERCGYRFFPIATESLSLRCAVDILFLRPEAPGLIIKSGDIDNRLKTIFDALRLPTSKPELGGYNMPGEGEDPFYCLLEDDKLITQVSVETDALLEPVGPSFDANDARLVITVQLQPYKVTWKNAGFA